MLKFTAHASRAVLLCWPDGTNPLDQYERGEPLDKELVWQITQRQPPKTNDGARYVLSADKAGIFVVTPTDRVITVLRMGETQRRILAGEPVTTAPTSPPPAQPDPEPAPVQPTAVDNPADMALLLTFEFFPSDGSFSRVLTTTNTEVCCTPCSTAIPAGERHLRAKVRRRDKATVRVCWACLMKRKAEVWDE